jgi:putative N6-adenine-specific DNA methylase
MYSVVMTCPDETKMTLVRELEALGAADIEPGYKEVHCTLSEEQFYRAHLCLRTPSNIILVLKECAAKSEIMLRSQASRIKWQDYFDARQSFMVEAIQGDRGPEFMTSNELSRCIRLAIEEKFYFLKMPRPRVDLENPDVKIVVFSRNQRCSIGISTSGKAMHKRGYKHGEHAAPLKETLAAAILLEAGYDGSQVLLDGMCGSGTLAIEAAMIAMDKAPLIHRKKDEFGFERLKILNRDLWRKTQDSLRADRLDQPAQPIFARDIDSHAVDMSRANALRARVEKFIRFDHKDFFEAEKPAESGMVLLNLPYGERIGSEQDLGEFYRKIGSHLKHHYQGWTAAVLAAEEAPIAKLGLKAKRRIPILNGSLKCKLLIFELFHGKHREFVTKKLNIDSHSSSPLHGVNDN